MSFPTLDQSLPWTKKTNRTLENELSNIRSVVALNHRALRLIKCWKAHFQEFDSFSWFRATTDRMLESSFSRVRFVFLVQGKDWSNVGKLIFKSSICLLGSGQRLIECWKARFQEFDSFSWFRAGLIECWKAHFQKFDSFSWFRARTDRVLETSFSRVRFVFLVQGKDWSSVGKLIFKSSIRFLGSGQRLQGNDWSNVESSFSRVRFVFLVQGNDWSKQIELLKMSFPTFDQSLPWTKKTNRTLENELSNIRSVVALNHRVLESSLFKSSIRFLVQGNDWSNVGKLVFKSSIRFLGSGQWLIECWKAHFQEFDSFSWFRATTDRALESSIFKSSIRFSWFRATTDRALWLIKCWKAHFQEFDSFSWFRATTDRVLESSFSEFDSFTWFRATTDRVLESSFSRVRFVFLVQGNDWRKRIELLKMSFPTLNQSLPWTQENESNSWKWAFQHSISRCPEPRKRIELLKMSFPTLDQSLPWTKKTNRTLENELSNTRSVVALNQENESNSWKWAFQHSISRCPEPRKRIELLKMSFPTLDQSLPWTKKTNRTLENELTNTRSVVALNQENESNSWKWAFQHSISRCPEPRKRIELLKMSFPTFDQSLPWTIECWKAHFQEFDSFIGSGQRLIECWKAHFQEFDSFSWFRARTNRVLVSSFSRVRFAFLVQGKN